VAVGLGAGSACRSGRSGRDATASTGRADPDAALAVRVLAGEELMLARVTATIRRHRRLAPVLAGALSAHTTHVRLLRTAVPAHGSASASPTPTPVPPVPVGRQPALVALAGSETALTQSHARDAVAARSGPLARVLASLAAASAQQASYLAGRAPDGRGP
jgi:hypothetical protein